MNLSTVVVAACVLLTGCARTTQVREASGIARAGSELLIVSDATPGSVFRHRVPELLGTDETAAGLVATIVIDRARVEPFAGPLMVDPEGVALGANGEVLVISERLHSLLDAKGAVAEYPNFMTELGARGIEGLAVDSEGRVAALWEGGFASPVWLPTRVPGAGQLQLPALSPMVCAHDLPAQRGASVCQDGADVIVLDVPAAPTSSQAFRAPDLVWTSDGDGYIVLLSSSNAADDVFRFKWLQRFDLAGRRRGTPLNLCATGYLPQDLRSGAEGNFEGLGWFEPGEFLVLINDAGVPATAVIIDVNPWPSTDPQVACDEPL